jgi:NADPH2:quinone reductase
MATAVIVREHGGPEVLKFEDVEVGRPGPGELRICQKAIGLNFHDVYVRNGHYKTLKLPGIPGVEAAGVVEEVGEGVSGFKRGDRIAYTLATYGAYADERVVPAKYSVALPDSVSNELAAAVMVKGITAQLLLRRAHQVRSGDWVLVHAAAGGVGQVLSQWARHIGARVIGTVGSKEKADVARQRGCEFVILYREENFTEKVVEITNGRGVDVVYDSVGKDTFFGSLNSLAFFGHLVQSGQSSGAAAPFPVSALSEKSTKVSRPMCFHYIADRAVLEEAAAELFDLLARGIVKVEGIREYELRNIAQAHRDLESRTTIGSSILRT